MAPKPKPKPKAKALKANDRKTKAQAKKKAPSYADADYWDQLNALLKDADNYRANMGVQKSRVGEDYAGQIADMQRQRGRDLPNIQEDFAARGIVKSGQYGKRVGQYEEDYQDALGDLARQRDRSLQDISMGYSNYLDQWRLQKQAAIKSAIQRKLTRQKK